VILEAVAWVFVMILLCWLLAEAIGQMYLDEYSFRYNHRNDTTSLFGLVLDLATSRA